MFLLCARLAPVFSHRLIYPPCLHDVILLITFRYDVELFQRIESLIGKKLPAFPTQEEEVMMLVERVSEAQRFARLVSLISRVLILAVFHIKNMKTPDIYFCQTGWENCLGKIK